MRAKLIADRTLWLWTIGGSVTAAVAALAPAAQAQVTPKSVVTTDQVRAELMAHAPEGVVPGKTVWLGLKIEHQPHWHTYWKNPGDSGLPTTLQWTLPKGVKAGEIEWPTPRRMPIGPLVNHGYDGKLLLPVRVEVPAGFAADTLPIKLHAEWLVCKDVCIPESGDFALDLPARAAWSTQAAAFDAALAAAPRALVGATASASLTSGGLQIEVGGLPVDWAGKAIELFPETAGVLDNAAPRQATWNGNRWAVTVPLSDQRFESPQRMDAVLVPTGSAVGSRIGFAIAGSWPKLAQATAPGTSPAATPRRSRPSAASPSPITRTTRFGPRLWHRLATQPGRRRMPMRCCPSSRPTPASS